MHPEASFAETARVMAGVVAPTLSMGVLVRRPRVMRVAEALGFFDKAARTLRQLRDRHGSGPLMLATPWRKHAILLSASHVKLVLEATPDPFAAATFEKNAALAHFEPKVSLLSSGVERAARRRFNEQALDSDRRVHGMAAAFLGPVTAEASRLVDEAHRNGRLDWDQFIRAWYRMARCVVLGRSAAEDHRLTDDLAKLRSAGNWAFLHPGRKRLRECFHARVQQHLQRSDAGSLAARIAHINPPATAEPTHQVAHWLFAFDPGGMATFRALALLSTHPAQMEQAQSELKISGRGEDLPFLRACIVESLRLWPTTPAILRETTRPTDWESGVMPEGTSVLIFVPLFHRDEEALECAHRFAPELWLDRSSDDKWPLVPFSAGPGKCPAHNFVPMIGSAFLAAMMEKAIFEFDQPARLDSHKRLPGILDNYSITFTVRRR